ncbi:MAG: tRNA (N(6)-L-threonylcarbamoyladenosine(37)-C(2))-methylthiotransferase MtaB, partial [Dehalococcoidia bacterium]|nr:tRNA (N(6)-L-threonylcarbamoyladenosine(37)-C(2))-methylthiotransferase MtaB [Dehalococcoidia bacterium]
MTKKPEIPRIALDTVGCKLNQAESQLLAQQFAQAGYRLVSAADGADVYILNTCTVTHVADRKCRHLLRMAHGRNPDALVVAIGCYADRARQEMAQVEGVDLVLDNREKMHLLRLLEESGRLSRPVYGQRGLTAAHIGFRTRAFIKIHDGCNSFCSYCIVPLVRGREQSTPIDQVVAEIRHRIAGGYKEVVLTGTKIGSYNHDGVNLKGLLKHILTETGVARLRLSSLQPQEVSRELIGLWGDERLCRHFHLSLQSGCDAVLGRMKRHYTVHDYQRAVALIRGMVPEAAITTDIIVGFPGETEAEFEQSYQLCRQMEFARIHVFPYSPRQGTQAVKLPNRVGDSVKGERSQKMLALARENAQNFRRQFLGKTMTVLWEKRSGDGIWSGYT